VPNTITQPQLERYLWGAATTLRGLIDAGDYKGYIFPLLFFKRISDIYDEEFQQALDESEGDAEYAALKEHRFQIPEGAHWADVRNTATNVGAAIQRAMRQIESANPAQLDGIFGDAQWSNKDRLSDATLRDLIELFSTLALSIANVPQDELGQAYEYLIKKFADDSGHTAAEFYTNRTLVRLMTLMLDPRPGESLYDPTCGSGGMLLTAAVQLKAVGQEYRTLRLYGQELNLITSTIARTNLFLHGIEDFAVVRGDTLANPAFHDRDRLRQFDVILANPPYSIKQWDRTAWQSDPWSRNRFGVPPQGIADYAFFQHILASLTPGTGRCAILFPHGVLFRDAEAAMRAKIVDADLIECVLGLGPNLFYNSPMESCVVICRTRKPAERQGKILFINAVHDVTRERAQSFLEEGHIQRILAAYHAFADEPGYARVVDLDTIRANNSNLSIPLYIRPVAASAADGTAIVAPSLAETIANWEESSRALRLTMDDLFATLTSTVPVSAQKAER